MIVAEGEINHYYRHCDSSHSSLTAEHLFYGSFVGQQAVPLIEYRSKNW